MTLSSTNTGPPIFSVIPGNRPISVAFYDTHGDTEDLFSSYTQGLHEGFLVSVVFLKNRKYYEQQQQKREKQRILLSYDIENAET